MNENSRQVIAEVVRRSVKKKKEIVLRNDSTYMRRHYRDWNGMEIEGEKVLLIHKDGTVVIADRPRHHDKPVISFLHGNMATAKKLAGIYG
jgi:hypothetical protein